MDDEVPDRKSGAAPTVVLTLHDGQLVDVALLAWIREREGTWWASLELVLPARTQTPDGSVLAEPYPVCRRR